MILLSFWSTVIVKKASIRQRAFIRGGRRTKYKVIWKLACIRSLIFAVALDFSPRARSIIGSLETT